MKGQSAVDFQGSHRIHVGLSVSDIARSRRFYELLLGSAPSKERPGYVKFEPADPSVNLTLNAASPRASRGNPATHYGIQVHTSEQVQGAIDRFRQAGVETTVEEQTTCCYAVQNKVWVTDPDGNAWEVFVVVDADAPLRKDPSTACCEPLHTAEGSCC